MKNLLLWYIPQAAAFCWGVWIGSQLDPPISGMAVILGGVFVAAAYTGGANLIISLVARLHSYRRKPSGEVGGLGAGGRLLGESPQERQRVGVDKDLR